jgi:hypothetical protein
MALAGYAVEARTLVVLHHGTTGNNVGDAIVSLSFSMA